METLSCNTVHAQNGVVPVLAEGDCLFGNTSTGAALDHTRLVTYGSACTARQLVKKVVFLISDGKSTENQYHGEVASVSIKSFI